MKGLYPRGSEDLVVDAQTARTMYGSPEDSVAQMGQGSRNGDTGSP